MFNETFIQSPLELLKVMLSQLEAPEALARYDQFWQAEGMAISTAVDRAGTPWIKKYDLHGQQIDEIVYPPEYYRMLLKGYTAGVVWRAFANNLRDAYQLGYLTAFYDTGLYCPYTVSLATAASVNKYATEPVRGMVMDALLREDEQVWQGATWMTEIRGGSDLGASVSTRALLVDAERNLWHLNGEKYFSSNANADVAVVAARPEGAREGVRGLALFLVPRLRADGTLNVYLRRMKDKIGTRSVPTGEIELINSEAYLLGEAGHGIYLIMEVLNLSRVCNSVGSMALAQRAFRDAYDFAANRQIFGKKLIDQPLMRRQFEQRCHDLRRGFCMAWETVKLLEEIWMERAPNYSDRFHYFRLITHLAKYWTAEFAAQTAKWAMEVNGGQGTLAEFGVERWLREAMIVDIWEGPPHRQMLDGLEVMERKHAHETLFAELGNYADPADLAAMQARIEALLALPQDQREAEIGDLFPILAGWTADLLLKKHEGEKTAI